MNPWPSDPVTSALSRLTQWLLSTNKAGPLCASASAGCRCTRWLTGSSADRRPTRYHELLNSFFSERITAGRLLFPSWIGSTGSRYDRGKMESESRNKCNHHDDPCGRVSLFLFDAFLGGASDRHAVVVSGSGQASVKQSPIGNWAKLSLILKRTWSCAVAGRPNAESEPVDHTSWRSSWRRTIGRHRKKRKVIRSPIDDGSIRLALTNGKGK